MMHGQKNIKHLCTAAYRGWRYQRLWW